MTHCTVGFGHLLGVRHILSAEAITVNKTKSLPSRSIHSNEGRQIINRYIFYNRSECGSQENRARHWGRMSWELLVT